MCLLSSMPSLSFIECLIGRYLILEQDFIVCYHLGSRRACRHGTESMEMIWIMSFFLHVWSSTQTWYGLLGDSYKYKNFYTTVCIILMDHLRTSCIQIHVLNPIHQRNIAFHLHSICCLFVIMNGFPSFSGRIDSHYPLIDHG